MASVKRGGSETGEGIPVQLTLFGLPDTGPLASATPPAEAGAPSAAGGEEIVFATPLPVRQASAVPASELPQPISTPLAPAADAPLHARPGKLSAAVEEYKEYLVAANRSKHTRESFALDLKLLLEHLGDVSLAAIGERDLRSFISWVRLERQNNPTSVRRKVASMKNFFAYLHRERLIPADPSLRLIYPEIYPALPEFLEDAQVARLLDAAAEHPLWHALLALMLDTGLKRDEVVALGATDVQLDVPEGQPAYLVVRETEQAKRLRSRRLEISAPVARLLRDFAGATPPQPRFFDLSPRGVNFIVETCGQRAHIVTKAPKLTPQILRETFAVRQMRAMVADEERRRATGAPEEALTRLIEQHDVQLLRLLGLHEEPESAKKYRKLVHGWSEPIRA
jgi:site-specific recombinase XerD